jgi:hypothetical protein
MSLSFLVAGACVGDHKPGLVAARTRSGAIGCDRPCVELGRAGECHSSASQSGNRSHVWLGCRAEAQIHV